jgi:hypothetical protein
MKDILFLKNRAKPGYEKTKKPHEDSMSQTNEAT